MQLGAARTLERWAAGWARRRQGADTHAVELKRRRIYVLPTRFGIVFAAMVFAMLLGSLNYGASLGFALTFLLAGALLGATFAWVVSDDDAKSSDEPAGLAALGPGDYLQLGISILTLARQFSSMVRKA